MVIRWRGLEITYRFARLLCIFWLSVATLSGCFWVILTPTSVQIDTAMTSIMVAIVTAWISAMTSGNFTRRR